MMWDVLGIALGFITVMLVLSLLVTSLVQVTQHLFQLRVKNLEYALGALLGSLQKETDRYAPAAVAKAVVDSASAPVPGKTPRRKKMRAALGGARCTWLTADELGHHLNKVVEGESATLVKEAVKAYPELEKHMNKRLSIRMRYLSLGWAVVVAFLFQVSSPDVLTRLATDPEYRARVLAEAESLRVEAPETLEILRSYQNVSDQALAELQNRHSDLSPVLEEASGIGTDRDDLLKELRDVLSDVPDRQEQLVKEYGEILDELNQKGLKSAQEQAQKAISQLAILDIQPWSGGFSFYADLRNWVGVLMTAVFLMLGAPVWFEMLKKVANLRDLLKPLKSSD